MRISEIIKEAPIQDYDTIGDFSKNSSFRDRDRHLITNPATIEYVKKKFGSTDHAFNLFFVNSPKARNHTEVGKVDMAWVEKNLGEDVAKRIAGATDIDNSINVIFTNNKGAQGKNMTAWIMAHRIAHVLARPASGWGRVTKQFQTYLHSADNLHSNVGELMTMYGKSDAPRSYDKMAMANDERGRKNQLLFKHLMTKICTFKSARDNKVRDWFEILHELFAQYVTTGKIKFNPAPKSFGTVGAYGGGTGQYHLRGDAEEANDHIDMMGRDIEYMFDDLLSEAVGSILVM